MAVLVLVSLVNRIRGGKKSHTRSPQHVHRRCGTRYLRVVLCRLVAVAVWALISPLGWLVANKRYGVVEPALRPFEDSLTARCHRAGHALCVPVLLWPQWFVRCHW